MEKFAFCLWCVYKPEHLLQGRYFHGLNGKTSKQTNTSGGPQNAKPATKKFRWQINILATRVAKR